MGGSAVAVRQAHDGRVLSPSKGASAGPMKLCGIPLLKLVDRAALGGIALGFLLVFQPWGGMLRAGFFVTAFATILHIVTSHMEIPDE